MRLITQMAMDAWITKVNTESFSARKPSLGSILDQTSPTGEPEEAELR